MTDMRWDCACGGTVSFTHYAPDPEKYDAIHASHTISVGHDGARTGYDAMDFFMEPDDVYTNTAELAQFVTTRLAAKLATDNLTGCFHYWDAVSRVLGVLMEDG